jgi:hypothetical protein
MTKPMALTARQKALAEYYKQFELTEADVNVLKGYKVQVRRTSEGVQWECMGLISKGFPTSTEALKNLANTIKILKN